jgi:hypothetical protein
MAAEVNHNELSSMEQYYASVLISSYRESVSGRFMSTEENTKINVDEIIKLIDEMFEPCYGVKYSRFNSLLITNVFFRILEKNPGIFSSTEQLKVHIERVLKNTLQTYGVDNINKTKCVNPVSGKVDSGFLITIIIMSHELMGYKVNKKISYRGILEYVNRELVSFQELIKFGGRKTRKHKRKTKASRKHKRSSKRKSTMKRRRKK